MISHKRLLIVCILATLLLPVLAAEGNPKPFVSDTQIHNSLLKDSSTGEEPSRDRPNCTWYVAYSGGAPSQLSSGYRFWNNIGNNYSITGYVSNLDPGTNYSVTVYSSSGSWLGSSYYILTNQSSSQFSFNFSGLSGHNGTGYRFKLCPQGNPYSPWNDSQSPDWATGPLPNLTVTCPSTVVEDESFTVTWNVSGGINGLTNGGWYSSSQLRFQWYQYGSPGSNIFPNVTLGVNSGSRTITASQNPGSNYQIGVSNVGSGSSCPDGMPSDLTNYFTIEQEPYLTVNPPSRTVAYQSGTTNFTITSNVSWQISENASWLYASPSSGNNNDTFNVVYQTNPSTSTRSATITVSGNGVSNQYVTLNQGGAPVTLDVIPDTETVSHTQGSTTVEVTSNVTWTASESVDWFSVSGGSGSGDGSFSIQYQENTSTSSRSGIVTVSGSGASDTFELVQQGAPAYLTVQPSTQEVDASSGSVDFSVDANVSWTATESASWLSLQNAGGNGDVAFTAQFDQNTTTQPRTATITVTGPGVAAVDVTVVQGPAAGVLNVIPETETVSHTQGSTTVEVTSNVTWTASESVDWFSVSGGTGSGDGSFTIQYQQNTSTSSRSGIVTVSGSGASDTYELVQQGAPAYLTVQPQTHEVDASSGSVDFSVDANVSWNATESASWLSLQNANGNGSGSFTAQFDQNTSTQPRTATITVTGPGVAAVDVTVVQAAAAGTLQVLPSQHTVSWGSGIVQFTVIGTVSWTATEDSDWFSLTSASGTGTGSFSVVYDENPLATLRTGDITISGAGIAPVTVNLVQMGAPAYLTVTPQTVNIGPGETAVEITIQSNTTWYASEYANWLGIVPPSSGNGDGTVFVSVDGNSGSTNRTADIIIAGSGVDTQIVTFVQEGMTGVIENVTITTQGGFATINWSGPDNAYFHVYRSTQPDSGFSEIGLVLTSSYTDLSASQFDQAFYYITYEYLPGRSAPRSIEEVLQYENGR